MQKQNDAVNGFVVIIFVHYILSDKAVWNEKESVQATEKGVRSP